MIDLSVELMDSDELNEWIKAAILDMDGSNQRGVVTMSLMINMFQSFMEENPEIESAFEDYCTDNTDEETLH